MKTKHTITRRGFIEKSALGSLVLSTVLVGSSTDNRIIEPNDTHQAGTSTMASPALTRRIIG